MNETQYPQKIEKKSVLSKVLWTIALLAIIGIGVLYWYGSTIYQTL